MRLRDFISNNSGAVTVEASFMIMIMVALTGATVEAGYAYWQWNGAQQAARHGARLAATSDPVARDLVTMTGLGGRVVAGDPMPDYQRNCFGQTSNCDQGVYDSAAMNAIVFGPDLDMTCGATDKERRGMCDVFGSLGPNNVKISYVGSGLGRAGNPASPSPMISVTVTNLSFDFAFLDLFLPESLTQIPDVTVTAMGEDLRSGT